MVTENYFMIIMVMSMKGILKMESFMERVDIHFQMVHIMKEIMLWESKKDMGKENILMGHFMREAFPIIYLMVKENLFIDGDSL